MLRAQTVLARADLIWHALVLSEGYRRSRMNPTYLDNVLSRWAIAVALLLSSVIRSRTSLSVLGMCQTPRSFSCSLRCLWICRVRYIFQAAKGGLKSELAKFLVGGVAKVHETLTLTPNTPRQPCALLNEPLASKSPSSLGVRSIAPERCKLLSRKRWIVQTSLTQSWQRVAGSSLGCLVRPPPNGFGSLSDVPVAVVAYVAT